MKSLTLLMAIFAVINLRAQTEVTDEKVLITAAVQNYIEGRNGDVERLKKAFLPSASLKGVSKTKELAITPVIDYIARQTAGKKQDCTSEISFINYVNEVAVAHVILKYQTFAYYDYLVLMKITDKWIIVDKFYTRKKIAK